MKYIRLISNLLCPVAPTTPTPIAFQITHLRILIMPALVAMFTLFPAKLKLVKDVKFVNPRGISVILLSISQIVDKCVRLDRESGIVLIKLLQAHKFLRLQPGDGTSGRAVR